MLWPYDIGRLQKMGNSKAFTPLTHCKLNESSMVVTLQCLFLCVGPCTGCQGKDDPSKEAEAWVQGDSMQKLLGDLRKGLSYVPLIDPWIDEVSLPKGGSMSKNKYNSEDLPTSNMGISFKSHREQKAVNLELPS